MKTSKTGETDCTKIDERVGIPNEEVLEKFVKTGEIDYKEIDERAVYCRKGLENKVGRSRA